VELAVSKKTVSSLDDAMELLKTWKSEGKSIAVAFFSTRSVEAMFMVRARSIKLAEDAVIEFGGPGGFGMLSLEGATVAPTSGLILHSLRSLFERVKPLIPSDSCVVELLLRSQDIVLVWDLPGMKSSSSQS
jgi:hypothetical protein